MFLCVYTHVREQRRKSQTKEKDFVIKRGIWNKELSLIELSNFKESPKTRQKIKVLSWSMKPKINENNKWQCKLIVFFFKEYYN